MRTYSQEYGELVSTVPNPKLVGEFVFLADESDNHLNIVVDRCLNVELANTFGVPELAKIGCDHDIVAYPPLEERTNSVFRRPCNLAKDGVDCDFHFYRKGFEPAGPYEIH